MKIFDPKLTGSIEILNTISGNVTIAGGLTVEGSLGGSATTASYVEYSDIANKPALISSSAQIASDISGSFTNVSSSLEQRVSTNEGSISSLNSASSSYLLNTTDTLDGNLTVTGTITAQEFHTEFVSASILYDSGSTKFGNSSDDLHSFTGSLSTTGNVGIGTSNTNGKLTIAYTSTSPSISSDSGTGLNLIGNTGVRLNFGTLPGAPYNAWIQASNGSTTAYSILLNPLGGNVGIGTTSPGYKLQIVNNTDGYQFGINGGTSGLTYFATYLGNGGASLGTRSNHQLSFFTNDSDKMTITSGGNVGIGTTSPTFAEIDTYTQRGLHISGTKESGTAPVIRLTETGSGKGSFEIRSNRQGTTSGNMLQLGEAADTFMVIRGDDDGGGTSTRGFVGIGTTSPSAKLHVAGEILTTNPDPLIRLSPDSGTSAFIQKLSTANGDYLRIYDGTEYTATFKNGSIGIGTDAPYRTVHVNGANATLRVGPYYTSGGDRDFVELIAHGSDSKIVSNNERFHIENNAGDIVLVASGGVGIGNTTPSAKLDINNANNSPSPIIMKLNGDGNSQGSAYNYKIVQHYPAVSSGNKLIIPFTSQGNLNGSTIVKIWGHSAMWNARLPKAFSAEFAVGHLTVLSDLTILSSTGNISNISIAGMNIEIDFASAYTSATANGLYLTLEYMTYIPAYSIIVGNITMN